MSLELGPLRPFFLVSLPIDGIAQLCNRRALVLFRDAQTAAVDAAGKIEYATMMFLKGIVEMRKSMSISEIVTVFERGFGMKNSRALSVKLSLCCALSSMYCFQANHECEVGASVLRCIAGLLNTSGNKPLYVYLQCVRDKLVNGEDCACRDRCCRELTGEINLCVSHSTKPSATAVVVAAAAVSETLGDSRKRIKRACRCVSKEFEAPEEVISEPEEFLLDIRVTPAALVSKLVRVLQVAQFDLDCCCCSVVRAQIPWHRSKFRSCFDYVV